MIMVDISDLLRIIPALAGNTQATFYYSLLNGDHPRSRGEYWEWS